MSVPIFDNRVFATPVPEKNHPDYSHSSQTLGCELYDSEAFGGPSCSFPTPRFHNQNVVEQGYYKLLIKMLNGVRCDFVKLHQWHKLSSLEIVWTFSIWSVPGTVWGPVQTSNFSHEELNNMMRSTFELVISTTERLRFDYPTFHVLITNTLNKLICTQNSALFLSLSCAHTLFWSFGTKWRKNGKSVKMWSFSFESTKYTCLMCINLFCIGCSVFENDESVAGWKGAVLWRTASHVCERNDKINESWRNRRQELNGRGTVMFLWE